VKWSSIVHWLLEVELNAVFIYYIDLVCINTWLCCVKAKFYSHLVRCWQRNVCINLDNPRIVITRWSSVCLPLNPAALLQSRGASRPSIRWRHQAHAQSMVSKCKRACAQRCLTACVMGGQRSTHAAQLFIFSVITVSTLPHPLPCSAESIYITQCRTDGVYGWLNQFSPAFQPFCCIPHMARILGAFPTRKPYVLWLDWLESGGADQ